MRAAESSLKVQEGVASKVLPSLAHEQETVLVFISKDANSGANRLRFSVLKQVAERIDTLIAERSEQKWNALVEALTPDVELSHNRVVEAEMLAEGRRIVLESGDFVKAAAIANAADFSSKNPSSQPNRWKRNGQIFAIHYKGVDLYPSYALDHSDGVRPLPSLAPILSELADKDDWQKAFWFESPNSYLSNCKPKSLLRTRVEDVLRAAKIEAVGVQHG